MQQLISTFESISLQEMGGIKLMNRIDTKFVTTLPLLRQLLKMAREEYRIQQINGQRNMLYNTIYYDTMAFDMYNMHQTGHANRQKIRFRSYVDSNLRFLEIKTKNNHGRTKKKRIEIGDINLYDCQQLSFIRHHLRFPVEELQPAIENSFRRITLVNNAKTERVTIDTNLEFHNLVTLHDRNMNRLVIIELKRDGLCYSPILEMLRQLRIHPHGFSKYCMGSALTNPQLQVNRFKPKLIDIRKIESRITPNT